MDIMPPENQLPPHHAPTGLKLWLAVFGVVLVIALGYLVWAENSAPDTTDNSAAVTKKTTASETADWKSYTDTKSQSSVKFSIKYPRDWEVANIELTVAAGIDTYGFRPITLKNDYLFIVDSSDGTLAEMIAIQKSNYEKNSKLISETTTTLSGEKATILTYENNSDPLIKPVIYLTQPAAGPTFVLAGLGASSSAADEKIMKQMLNTFKILP